MVLISYSYLIIIICLDSYKTKYSFPILIIFQIDLFDQKMGLY